MTCCSDSIGRARERANAAVSPDPSDGRDYEPTYIFYLGCIDCRTVVDDHASDHDSNVGYPHMNMITGAKIVPNRRLNRLHTKREKIEGPVWYALNSNCRKMA